MQRLVQLQKELRSDASIIGKQLIDRMCFSNSGLGCSI